MTVSLKLMEAPPDLCKLKRLLEGYANEKPGLK